MGRFKSLAAELEGHYGKPEHHLPDDLRDRVRRAFAAFYPWDVLSSDRQRDWASRWWRGRAAFKKDAALEQDRTWPLVVEIGDLKTEISEVEAMPAINHTERGKKKTDLAKLRQELAHKELALEGLIREELAPLEAQTHGTTTPAEPPVELAPVDSASAPRAAPSPAPTEQPVEATKVTPPQYPRRIRGAPKKDDDDLVAKVRCALADNKELSLYAAVQRHCGEQTKNGVEAAYKRVRRKIHLKE
jgi:hypothetical protein